MNLEKTINRMLEDRQDRGPEPQWTAWEEVKVGEREPCHEVVSTLAKARCAPLDRMIIEGVHPKNKATT